MLSPEGIAGVPSFASVLQISDAHAEAAVAEFQEGFTWWRRPDLITIAAVHGHAVGAGFQLALACDLRVCAEDAQFSMRETSLGLVPDLAGAKVLVDLVGYSRALEICTTGRWVQAQEAHQLGIATVVVPSGDLDASVRDLVDALVTAPAEAVRATKQLLLAAQEQSYDDNRALAARLQITRLRALLALPRD